MNSRNLIALSAIFVSFTGNAQVVSEPEVDSTINILVLKEPSVDQAIVNAQMSILTSQNGAWLVSDFIAGDAPVTLTVINSGAALQTPGDLTTDSDGLIATTAGFVSTEVGGLPSLRDSLAADVVIIFVDRIVDSLLGELCGWAPQGNWLARPTLGSAYLEDPATDDLDLRGAEDYFVAAVSSTTACNGELTYDTAAHEFGHLLGAGHFSTSPAPQPGVLENSRALAFNMFWPYIGTRTFRTVMGLQSATECAVQGIGAKCIPTRRFSDNYYNDLSRKNTDAIDTTAVAVANYRRGEPSFGFAEQCLDGIDNDGDGLEDGVDPDCSTSVSEVPPPPPQPPSCNSSVAPNGVAAYRVAICAPNPPPGSSSPSQYRITWRHSCEQDVAFYEVWSELPPGVPPAYEWTVFGTSTDGYIDGIFPAKVLIRSCGNAGCSLLFGGPIVVDEC